MKKIIIALFFSLFFSIWFCYYRKPLDVKVYVHMEKPVYKMYHYTEQYGWEQLYCDEKLIACGFVFGRRMDSSKLTKKIMDIEGTQSLGSYMFILQNQ